MYKLFARMVYHRISPILLSCQSRDQFGFTPGVRIEEALLVADQIVSHSIEFNIPVWLISMDLRKAFDRIEHRALFDALQHCGLDDGYVALLQQLYSSQLGSANDSEDFPITRGVKQGDVLSSLLFNCVLDFAMNRWKLRIRHCGILIDDPNERLTDSRCADDTLIFAKALDEAILVLEVLIKELNRIGLNLNFLKTKIFHTAMTDDGHDVAFADIAGEIVEILDVDAYHRYLGKRLSLTNNGRSQIEVTHRIESAWAAFHKHRKIILNSHIPLHLRLKFSVLVHRRALCLLWQLYL